MKKVLVIAPVITEVRNDVDELPKGNEEFTPLKTELKVTGSGYEIARILKSFDFPYELIASIGTGVFGETAQSECKKYGIPYITSNAIQGCLYTLIDKQGREGTMSISGAEYGFNLEDIQYVDVDDISYVTVSGLMLTSENASDLVQALEDLEKPILFIPENCIDGIDENVFQQFMALKPEIFLNESEAYFLAGACTNDMLETTTAINQEYGILVHIISESHGIFMYDVKEQYFVANNQNTQMNTVVEGYVVARVAGIDHKNACHYAIQFAQDCDNDVLNDEVMESEKRMLADTILGKLKYV